MARTISKPLHAPQAAAPAILHRPADRGLYRIVSFFASERRPFLPNFLGIGQFAACHWRHVGELCGDSHRNV